MKTTADTDVDENGQPIRDNEPRVSKLTGKRRVGKHKAINEHNMECLCRTFRAGYYVKQAVIANGA